MVIRKRRLTFHREDDVEIGLGFNRLCDSLKISLLHQRINYKLKENEQTRDAMQHSKTTMITTSGPATSKSNEEM